MSSLYQPVRKLLATDIVDQFDCGKADLNQFLQRYALVNQKANSAQTYVCCCDSCVVGFYSLAVGSVNPESAPTRVTKGLAKHAVPVMILARLAVDQEHQGNGLGKALLILQAFALHWFMLKMMTRALGIRLGSLNLARPIPTTYF